MNCWGCGGKKGYQIHLPSQHPRTHTSILLIIYIFEFDLYVRYVDVFSSWFEIKCSFRMIVLKFSVKKKEKETTFNNL